VADFFHDLVHRPPVVQVSIRQDRQGDAVLGLIALDGRQGVVPVPRDALIDGQEAQVQAVGVAGVQQGQQVGEHSRVLTARRGDGDDLARGKEAASRDGGVDLLL